MAAPWHTIEKKLAAALVAYLEPILHVYTAVDVPFYSGFDDPPLNEANCVICKCASAAAYPDVPGNYQCEAEIVVQSRLAPLASRATLIANHWLRVGYLLDAMMQTDIVTTLTGKVTDFSVQAVYNPSALTNTERRLLLVSTLKLNVICNPA